MVFAQELSEDFAISSFHPFDPDHYNSIPFFPAPIPREVGQLGLMGYISREGEVVFDNADRLRTTLRNKLAHGDSSLEGAAFFSLEARCFVNDATRVVSALENISLTIRGTENRTAWKTITEAAIQYSQTTSSNRARAKKSDQSSAAIESDHSIDFQNYQSAEWPQLVAFWKHYNLQLAHTIRHCPPEKHANTISIEGAGPFRLDFIMADYVEHLKHHLRAIIPQAGLESTFSNVYNA